MSQKGEYSFRKNLQDRKAGANYPGSERGVGSVGGSIKETIVSYELSLLVRSDQPALNCCLTGENLLSRSLNILSQLSRFNHRLC